MELQNEQDEKTDIFSRRRAMSDADIDYDVADFSTEDDMESTCSGSTGQESCGQSHQGPDMHPNLFASSAAQQVPPAGYVWSAVPVFMFVPVFVPHCLAGEQRQEVLQHASTHVENNAGSEHEGLARTAGLSRRQRKLQRKQMAEAEASKSNGGVPGADSTSIVGSNLFEIGAASTPIPTSDAILDAVEDGPPTTIIIRNLSTDCTRDDMLQLLQTEGYAGSYDMVHVPVGFQDLVGCGHALVNFLDPATAQDALSHFDGFGGLCSGAESCEAGWSNVQGLAAHVKRYRDSPIMHESIPSSFKPAMFVEGVQVPFPGPTKRLKAPRVRNPKLPLCT